MLLSVGHGRLDRDALSTLLTTAGIDLLVDIRRFPGSSSNPAASRGSVPQIARDAGIGYQWEEDLGGRRTLDASQRRTSPDTWWRVEAFRAYSAWTRDPAFRAALTRVLTESRRRRTAIMCSESVWWRCHRRIVADVVTAVHDLPVGHLMHSGEIVPHPQSEGLRLDDRGEPVWSG